jgi:hypothetical protein
MFARRRRGIDHFAPLGKVSCCAKVAKDVALSRQIRAAMDALILSVREGSLSDDIIARTNRYLDRKRDSRSPW